MRSIPGAAAIGLTASLYATTTAAQATFRTGESDDIRFQWGVPEQSASSGSGNVYLQLDAPDSYSWVGLGIGSSMSGADIFLLYQDGDGNVTLSTRQAKGHKMPEWSEVSGVDLIEGSGVTNGRMVANVRCADCGSLDLKGDNDWIAAWKAGEPIDSSNPRAPIEYHDSRVMFSVDFSQAGISSDANPFVKSEDSGDSEDSGNSEDSGDSGDSGNSGDEGGSAVTEEEGDKTDTLVLAHGVIMAIVFVVLYPLGAMVMPLLGKWFIHSASQLVAFLLMWAGFGCGYVYAHRDGIFFHQAHTGLGTVVVALLGLQPIFGYMHHRHYAKYQGRGIISHIHIWYGRILVVIGIINGGVGLKLVGNTSGAFVIAYSVVAGVVAVAYLGSVVFGQVKRRRVRTKEQPSSPADNSPVPQQASG